jgi:uncharacterized protein YndB with AHSA1/START domain
MHASPEALYRAGTTEFDRWFASPGSVRMDDVVGAPFFFETEFENARHPHYGRFLSVDPGRLVKVSWGTRETWGTETVLTVTFSPDGSGTSLHVEYSGFPDEAAKVRHRDAWPVGLEHLEGTLRAPSGGSRRIIARSEADLKAGADGRAEGPWPHPRGRDGRTRVA